MMRDLEVTDTKNLKILYTYKMADHKEFLEEASVVLKDYKKEIMDPLREVAKLEMKGKRGK
jgi:hypothetical protein